MPSAHTPVPAIKDDVINVRIEIKHLPKLFYHSPTTYIVIVTIGVSSIDAMHQRFILGIGFNAERSVAVTMRLHLLGIKDMNLTNPDFHQINHCLTKRPVIRQEVDHPHGARFAHVQRQPLARRARVIAPPLLVID